jgi:hypothetical protein
MACGATKKRIADRNLVGLRVWVRREDREVTVDRNQVASLCSDRGGRNKKGDECDQSMAATRCHAAQLPRG